jgi:uncharacterized protein YndB with AHSA1/START domain/uncharacterized glyoxalase superfamily protein PhnB
MSKAALLDFQVDKSAQQITVKRSFNAPVDMVWKAWTEAEILDQWWAPKPWKTETKHMDFRVGGQWLYAMVGPEGDKHWNRVDYLEIQTGKYYSSDDAFCDEYGKVNTNMPRNRWENTFEAHGDETTVHIVISCDALEDLETIVNMGFKEGFTTGLENLDQYLAAQFQLRKAYKREAGPRASIYLNFPGNTEEAFLFYKAVFQTDFVEEIRRFRSIPPEPDQPPMPESVKDMVLHVELPIVGGLVLMGTDAPEEFGMNVQTGNNMYINLEPTSREEAKRLFEALSEGGKIEMPLQDMFWGAYYGSFKDRYGINWMVNHQPL